MYKKARLNLPQFWSKILWTDKIKINCNWMMGRERCGGGRERHDLKQITAHVNHEGSVMAWACTAASGTGSRVFTDDVTADRRRTNSDVYMAVPSAQIQTNTAELTGWRFTAHLDNDPKHTAKACQELHLLSTQLSCFCTYMRQNWS